jgi:monofunctional biosynthetic peptidoglycan transglycosylase
VFDVARLATPPSSWPPLHGFDLWPDPALRVHDLRVPDLRVSDLQVSETDRVLQPATNESLSQSAVRTLDAAPSIARAALRVAGLVAAAWIGVTLFLIAAYRFVDPPFSMLMLQQRASGDDVNQAWVPLDYISPHAVRAVLLSEDGRFCQHWGIDLDEMQNAIERAGDGIPRGASTISMQVTKNLFLWQSKSFVRKAIEIPLTFVIEALWPKRRIMEVYLNIAEWGPGIFGVEAASRYHFDKPAARLNEREAAQLAVALPNPIRRDAGDPGPQTRRLASDIQARMRAASSVATACVRPRPLARSPGSKG